MLGSYNARTQPERDGLACPLDSSQHIVREHHEAQQCRQLVAVRVIPFADYSLFLVPRQNGVWFGSASHILQFLSAESLTDFGQCASFWIREPQSAR
jgi:hypothetical protein